MGFFQGLVMHLVMAALGVALVSFVLSFLAEVFGGKPNFSRAFAAMSLAFIPAFVAGIVGALIPWIGFLVSLAGSILSLVFLYRIIPLALDVPDGKRVVHFVVSLVAMFVINMILSFMLGFGSARDFREAEITTGRSVQQSGVLGEIERQQQIQQAALEDDFDPPEDGKLERSQVVAFVEVMQKTRAVHEKYQEKMDTMREEMEGKEQASINDLANIYSGFQGAMSAQNAEMEIVKTGGGNWAEHVWVKNQLRVATIQQGTGSETLEHNFALYEEFEDELEEKVGDAQ